jgi:hypothetical protein
VKAYAYATVSAPNRYAVEAPRGTAKPCGALLEQMSLQGRITLFTVVKKGENTQLVGVFRGFFAPKSKKALKGSKIVFKRLGLSRYWLRLVF